MKNNIKKILTVLCIISLIINGVLGYQLYNSNQKLSQNIVDNTNKKIVSLNDELEKLKTEYESVNTENLELKNINSQNAETISKYESDISTYESQIENLNAKIDNKDAKISKLKSQVSSLKSDKKSLQSQIKSQSSKTASTSTSSYDDDDDYGVSGTASYTVYVTETGSKYHTSGCRYLWNSSIAMSKSEAIAEGYSACSVCNP